MARHTAAQKQRDRGNVAGALAELTACL
eukprot:COSAG01_NODE_53798_length_336_cov_1.312236_1_plen_27_part_10